MWFRPTTRRTRGLIVSRIIVDTFKSLDLRYPETDAKRRRELLSIRSSLMKEGADRA